jgi:hypothetical protein
MTLLQTDVLIYGCALLYIMMAYNLSAVITTGTNKQHFVATKIDFKDILQIQGVPFLTLSLLVSGNLSVSSEDPKHSCK